LQCRRQLLQTPDVKAAGIVDLVAADHGNRNWYVLRGFVAATCADNDFFRRIGVAGSGGVASRIPEDYRAVLPIEEVTVWSRTHEAAQRMAGQLNLPGCSVAASADLAQAVRAADLVSCATLATDPIIQGEWLAPGSHLDLIGGFTPAMREADDACFAGSRLYVDTGEALQKSGDLLGPMSRGVFAADDVAGTLASLCRGQGGRGNGEQVRTVFKSVGTAREALAAAMLVADRLL